MKDHQTRPNAALSAISGGAEVASEWQNEGRGASATLIGTEASSENLNRSEVSSDNLNRSEASSAILDELLTYNKEWAVRARVEDPQYFDRMAYEQHPRVLWIGCSDSRVPPSVITGAQPGMLFIHRNIANQAVHSDISFLAVLEYSVQVLKVPHIVVAGHYNCGGVKAACSHKPAPDIVDHWIHHIRDIKRMHQPELDTIEDSEQRENRLVELNVIEQVRNIVNTTTVRRARDAGQHLEVHGLVYDTATGELKPLVVHPG